MLFPAFLFLALSPSLNHRKWQLGTTAPSNVPPASALFFAIPRTLQCEPDPS
jgi:hypothetical protein